MAHVNTCARCGSAVCDGRLERCMGCGMVQCFGNGLGRGTCKVCHFGILPGWSGWSGQCSYKGCTERGAFKGVRGKAYVCLQHATQAKPGGTGHKGESLAQYAARNAAEVCALAGKRFHADHWRTRGVCIPEPPITLPDGAIVRHHVNLQGAQVAELGGGAEMTPVQWDAYCAIVRLIAAGTDPRDAERFIAAGGKSAAF